MQQHYNENQAPKGQVYVPGYEAGYMSAPYDLQQNEQQYYQYAQSDTPEPQAMPYTTTNSYTPDQQSASSRLFYTAYSPYTHNGTSMDGKLAAALCYIGFWLTGLLFVLFVHDNKFIRFHAMQSLLFFGGANILFIAFISTFSRHFLFFHFLGGFAILALVLVIIIASVGWLVGLFGALSGKYIKLPFVSNYAERFASHKGTVK